jgi:hypothetical protein
MPTTCCVVVVGLGFNLKMWSWVQDKKVRKSCRAFCELSDKAMDDGCDFATKPSEQLPERLGWGNEARVGIEPTILVVVL